MLLEIQTVYLYIYLYIKLPTEIQHAFKITKYQQETESVKMEIFVLCITAIFFRQFFISKMHKKLLSSNFHYLPKWSCVSYAANDEQLFKKAMQVRICSNFRN